MNSRLTRLFSLALTLAGALAERNPAQCSTQWLPGQGMAGTDGPVLATTMWDPDGVGPMQPVLVVGGSFSIAGSVHVSNIAAYDPVSGAWSALGLGMNGSVRALIALPNGELVAGGDFTLAGGVSASRIARWNGTNWSALGSGVSAPCPEIYVAALTTLPNGDLVAGGRFTSPGSCIAQWNGTSWSALGSGVSSQIGDLFVSALTTLPNGDVVAGGQFTTAGVVTAFGIARWNGGSWSALGSGIVPGTGGRR